MRKILLAFLLFAICFGAQADTITITSCPVQTGSDKILYFNNSTTDCSALNLGTNLSISGGAINAAGGSAGGNNTDIQYNNSGTFAGNSGFTYDGAGNVLIGSSLNVDFIRDKAAVTSYFSLTGGVLGILPSGTVSVDFINRILFDASNGSSVLYDTRQLHDSANLLVADWQNRLLTAAGGSTNLIDFSNVNANGNYYFSSGILQGDGSGLTNVRGVWTTSGTNIYNNNAGGVGVGQSTPLAQLHVSPTAPLPSNFTSSISINVSQGYAFGSGDKSYSLYGENSSVPVFTTPITTTFSEPPSTNFDPTGGAASFNTGGSGYTASGYDFQYQWWALYNGNTQIGSGSTTTSGTGGDPNDGSNYSVDVSVTAPSQGSPSGYLVQCQGSNPFSGQYQVVGSTSFSDVGTGWSSSPSFSPLLYDVSLLWTLAPSPIDNYIIVNGSTTTYLNAGFTGGATDDTSWTSGSPTVTPTGESKTAIFDGNEIDINGFSYLWPSSLPATVGFLSTDNVGNLNWGPIGAGNITVTNDQILYGSGGIIFQSSNLRFNSSTFTLNADFVLNEIRDDSSSGTLNNYGLNGISTVRFSNPVTITGFSGGIGGKVVNVMSANGTPIILKNLNSGSSTGNQITTPTGTDMTAPANSIIQLIYEAGTGTWFVGSIGKPDVTLLANTWAQNQTLNAVNLITDTTTGMKIGTAITQKLGFFNATPVVQQGATTDLGVALSNLGLRASGTAYPISTSGAVALTGTTNNVGTITTGIWNGTAIANAKLANSTISGVALGGTLNALTATNSTLTFSGSYTGAAAQTVGLNLANANTWSAKQTAQLITEQLRLGYDGSNYASFTTGSTGSLTIGLTGTSPTITLTNPVSIGDGVTNQDLLTFNSARAWVVGASGSGAATDLTLRPSSDLKNFRITSSNATTNYLTIIAANTASSGSVVLGQGGSSVGVGTSPSAKLHVLGTTEQLRLGFDSTHYLSATVASTGSTTFALTGTSPTFTYSQPVIFGAQARLKGYTVSTLPTGTQGDTAFVTDALAPTYMTTVVGGGAIVTPVFYNGTNWVAD